MIRGKIKKDLASVIQEVTGHKPEQLNLEHPQNPEHGDYSSNWALSRFPKIKNKQLRVKTPFELAEKIVQEFPGKDYLEKIRVVKPGFINFYLSQKFFIDSLKKIVKAKENFGKVDLGHKKKVIIEFGQPNTHKLPHVGHFRSYALGESIARLLEFTGHNVFRANYQGDVGLFVAKCLWGWREKEMKESEVLEQNIKNLQKAYIYGSQKYETSDKAKKKIKELNIKIYEKSEEVYELWEKTRSWSLNYYRAMNKQLGTFYHKEYFESQAAEKGKEIVEQHTSKVFKKSRNAVVFPGDKYGLHTRVFLTSEGLPTYEAKDLALIFLKKQDFDYDLSLVSTATEQTEYFKVVYKAAEQIAPELAEKFTHIPFGLVSLTGTKLSSRKGNIVSIDELLNRVEDSLVTIMKEKKYLQSQIEKLKTPLTIGASKYSILKHTPARNISFDIKESVSLEGDSGPYLQYTYVRTKSILRKAKTINHELQSTARGLNNHNLNKKELDLLRALYRFPEVIEKAAITYNPSLICNYLFSLAQEFNSFYEKLPVLKLPVLETETEKKKKLRLSLVKAVSYTIKNGVYLLGIQVPEKM